MKEKQLPSGAVLAMQLSSLDECNNLLDAVLGELVGVKIEGFKLPVEGEDFNIRQLLGTDVWAFKDALFKVIKSRAVKEALRPCMVNCTYALPGQPAGMRISFGPAGTFESEKTRGDYFVVAGEVAAFNLAPFFANLVSALSTPGDQAAASSQRPSTG